MKTYTIRFRKQKDYKIRIKLIVLENTDSKDAENEVEQVTHTSLISNVDKCGRKSLPTKNTQGLLPQNLWKHTRTKFKFVLF